jgi:uncharacterized protein with NAD-binding domain and iron-sulfur cluster
MRDRRIELEDQGKTIMRVAIVGGGFAGIAAAWSLSQQKDSEGKSYEVHVYEKSWRLGGKAASTRDEDGSIRTNSLQVWLGFFENAFRMMRQCYAEVETYGWGPGRPEPLVYGRMEDAFFPEPNVGAGVGQTSKPPRDWAVWSAYLPPAKGLPGESLDEDSNPFTLASYLLRSFELLKTLMLSVIRTPNQDPPGVPRPDDRSTSDQILNFDYNVDGTTSLQLMIERTATLLRAGSLTGAAAWLQAVTILEVWLQDFNLGIVGADSALTLMDAVATQTRKLLRDFVGIDPDIRTKTEIIDMVLTIAVGLFRDRVMLDDNGLDSINQFDFREWLQRHGATKESLDSRFLTAVYDLSFAYADGDKTRPTLAAGVALRVLVRAFFTYRGSMFWRLRSGMGEAVFAPLYKVLKSTDRKVLKSPNREVLKSRNPEMNDEKPLPVRFHFLHELTGVHFDALNGKRYISSLEFKIPGPSATVDRLSRRALDDLGFWPDSPVRFDGATGPRKRTLELGTHFDQVIISIGRDDFSEACLPDDRDPKLKAEWTRTCDNVKTIATKSAQARLDRNLESLGWYLGSGIVTALGLSFDTWVDMTPSLATESLVAGRPPDVGSLAYFCAPLAKSDLKLTELLEEADKGLDAFRDHVLGQWNALPATNRRARASPQTQGFTDNAIASVTPLTRWTALKNEIRPALVVYAQTLLPPSSAGQAVAREKAKSLMVSCAANQEVQGSLNELLNGNIHKIWPDFAKQNQSSKPAMVKAQGLANFEGSNRFALSEPGLILHRISPLDCSVVNLSVAGDWTACGLDVGCAEAAVMSGLLASHAISKKPDLQEIIGYDHP